MGEIKIHAVKASAKIPETDLRKVEEFCKQSNIRCKRFNRDHLVVYDRHTFTFFKKSEKSWNDQHVNLAKLLSLDIRSAIEDLARIIDVEPDLIFHTIDNITAGSNLNLENFITTSQDLAGLIR